MTDRYEPGEDEQQLITELRAEARELKECFAKYSFQALGISTGVLTAVAQWQRENPYVGFATIPLIVFLEAVVRLGLHKYASANRLCGYELHLQRTMRIPSGSVGGWQAHMREVGWEEAMRAWRVVQATLFERLYGKHAWRPEHLTAEDHSTNSSRWFEPITRVGSGATYHAGSYLKTSFYVMYVVMWLSVLPPIIAVVQLALSGEAYQAYGSAMACAAGFVLFVCRVRWIEGRRRLLEDGLLSVHSCSIVWQAAIVAHFRAGIKLNQHAWEGYLPELGKQAASLKEKPFHVHEWIDGDGGPY